MLRDVLRSLVRRPATERYPLERPATPERLRGALRWDPGRCTGCSLCVKDCPANALELIMVDRAARRFVLRYRVDRCTFCAQCVQSCRPGALAMSPERWELAALSTAPFAVTWGAEDDVEAVLAGLARPDARRAAER